MKNFRRLPIVLIVVRTWFSFAGIIFITARIVARLTRRLCKRRVLHTRKAIDHIITGGQALLYYKIKKKKKLSRNSINRCARFPCKIYSMHRENEEQEN